MLTVHEYTDPACPFAFSFEPIRRRLLWTYGDGLRWRRRMIVLAESVEEYTRRGFTPERLHDGLREIQRAYGMPIDTCLRERMTASEPACRAIVAARVHAPEREDALVRQLRVLAMAGELIDEPRVVARAAAGAGLDARELERWMEDRAVARLLREDMRAARDPSRPALALDHRLASAHGGRRYTAPSITFEAPDGRRIDAPGLNPLETYEMAVANLCPGIPRRPGPESVEEVLAWAGEPLATAEVAMLLDVEIDEARSRLARVARHEPVGPDGYWSLAAVRERQAA